MAHGRDSPYLTLLIEKWANHRVQLGRFLPLCSSLIYSVELEGKVELEGPLKEHSKGPQPELRERKAELGG